MKTINKLTAIVIIVSISIFCTCVANSQNAKQETKLRNIVFFLVDDLGAMDLECYGSKFYQTPNIDRLAKQGMKFNQAYSTHPRCVPSRFSMMTGQYPARTSWRMGGNMKLEQVTIGEAMQEAGYTTFFVGKWHLGKEGAYPDDQGFDINIGGYHGGATGSHFAPYLAERAKKGDLIPGLEDAPDGEYLTDRITDETIKFIKSKKNKPFFAYVSHYSVHTPLQGKNSYTKHYTEKLNKMQKPDRPQYKKDGAGEGKLWQDNPVYASMIQSIDDSIGRILQTLDEQGIADNTIIIFTSDHGGLSNRGNNKRPLATSNYPLRAGKGWCYEGGIRVPLIMKAAGIIKAGSTSNHIVTGTDYYPTLLELLKLPLKSEQHKDGKSFAAVLQGKQQESRGPVFWHSPNGRPYSTGDYNCSVIRENDYKLIEWYDKKLVELFNIREDIGENKNLSKEKPEITQRMLTQLRQWRRDVKAHIDPDPEKTWAKRTAKKKKKVV